jgi:septation ring formation regulator EzrA
MKSPTNQIKSPMERITNRVNQMEESMPRIEDKVNEVFHSDSNKEKEIMTTAKISWTKLRAQIYESVV